MHRLPTRLSFMSIVASTVRTSGRCSRWHLYVPRRIVERWHGLLTDRICIACTTGNATLCVVAGAAYTYKHRGISDMPLWISCTGNERERRSNVTCRRFEKKENNAHYLYMLKPDYRQLHVSIQTDQFAKVCGNWWFDHYSITFRLNCHRGGLPKAFVSIFGIGVHPMAEHEQNRTQMWQCVLGYDDVRFPNDISTCWYYEPSLAMHQIKYRGYSKPRFRLGLPLAELYPKEVLPSISTRDSSV